MPTDLKTKTLAGVIWNSIERFSIAGGNFVFTLVMARLLTPSDYGVIAMLAVFLALADCFVDCGFARALVRKANRTERDNATAFYFNVCVGLAVYIILFFSAPVIAEFYQTPILIPVARVVGVTIIINSFFIVQNALLSSKLDFRTSAKASLISIVISGAAGIVCACHGCGVWALVVQMVSASLVRTVFLWVFSGWFPCAPCSYKSFRELFGFGAKLLATSLLDSVYSNLYTLIIGKAFPASSLGYYTRAIQWAHLPSITIARILQNVSFPALCSIQDDEERLAQCYCKFLRMVAFIIFPMMVGLAAVSKPLIIVFLTEKWLPSVPLLQIVCFALMWQPVREVNLSILQVKGRADLFFKLSACEKFMGVCILFLTVPQGLHAMCVGLVLSSCIYTLLTAHYCGRLVRITLMKQIKLLLPSILHSFMAGVVAYCSQSVISGMLMKLIVGTLAGALYYSGIHYFLKSVEWKEIRALTKR